MIVELEELRDELGEEQPLLPLNDLPKAIDWLSLEIQARQAGATTWHEIGEYTFDRLDSAEQRRFLDRAADDRSEATKKVGEKMRQQRQKKKNGKR